MADGALVQQIPAALVKALARNLIQGEQVELQMKGAWKEALICTDRRVMILKAGLMTGQTFGSGVFQLAYPMIASAEVKFGILTGYLEISAGGMQNTSKSYWSTDKNSDPAKAPNCVSISGGAMANDFRRACALIMTRISAARAPQSSAAGSADEVATALERLWKLKNDGAINAAEFDAAKAKLLAG